MHSNNFSVQAGLNLSQGVVWKMMDLAFRLSYSERMKFEIYLFKKAVSEKEAADNQRWELSTPVIRATRSNIPSVHVLYGKEFLHKNLRKIEKCQHS